MTEFPTEGGAIVTGGSGGLGAAICHGLAAAGVDVALTWRANQAAAERTAAAVRDLGAKAHVHRVDLADAAAVSRFVAAEHDALGQIHTVVSAHGPFLHLRYISKLTPDLFAKTLAADASAVFNLVHAVLPHLRESRGALVALATPAIRRAVATDLLSAAPKAAVEAIIKGVAVEEGRFGVRANLVGVGLIEDGMFQDLIADGGLDERFIAATRRATALRRLGTAREVADAVVFLASAKARYTTGQMLNVDGGFAL